MCIMLIYLGSGASSPPTCPSSPTPPPAPGICRLIHSYLPEHACHTLWSLESEMIPIISLGNHTLVMIIFKH